MTWRLGRNLMQRTTNDSEEYYISFGGTRLQTRRYGKGRDRKICNGKHHKKKKKTTCTLDGTRGKDGGRKTCYTGHGHRVRRGSVEEADCERTGRKVYVKTSDAWIYDVEGGDRSVRGQRGMEGLRRPMCRLALQEGLSK